MKNIFNDGVLVDVDVSFWSGAKVLKPRDLGLDPDKVVDAFRLGRKMLVPTQPIRKFRSVENRARRIVEINSFKFSIGNARFIPKKRFAKVLVQLKKCQDEYKALVEDFISNYSKYREEMVPIYKKAAETAYINSRPETQEFGPEYDPEAEKAAFVQDFLRRIESFYPPAESLRSRYSLTWDVYEIAVPRMRKVSDKKVVDDENKRLIAVEEYQRQIQKKMQVFIDDVVKVLRGETVEICERIKNNIEDGKVLRSQTIQSLRDFVDKFSELNFVGDKTVEDQLNSLRKEFLDIYQTKQINEDEDIQTELRRRLDVLVDAASDTTDINSITGEYRRKVEWEEVPAMGVPDTSELESTPSRTIEKKEF